jgi:hypothetical protein
MLLKCDDCREQFDELMDNGLCVICFSLNETRDTEELELIKKLILWPEDKRKEFIRLYESSSQEDNDKSVEILREAIREISEGE